MKLGMYKLCREKIMQQKTFPPWISSSPSPDVAVSEFIDYRKNDHLRKLLDGKRIAFVCPAPNLVGLNTGALIDSYDIVVRVGNLRDVSPSLYCDYGSRTDILVHSFNEMEIPEAKRNMEFFKRLKYVLCSMVSTDFIGGHTVFLEELESLGCKTENVDDRYLFRMFKEIGTIANVGMSGLVTLLNYDLKEIYVTGMTFYNMGKFGKCYNNEYYDVVTKKAGLYEWNENRVTTMAQARSDIHDTRSQISFFKQLVKTDKRIRLDNYLSENLYVC